MLCNYICVEEQNLNPALPGWVLFSPPPFLPFFLEKYLVCRFTERDSGFVLERTPAPPRPPAERERPINIYCACAHLSRCRWINMTFAFSVALLARPRGALRRPAGASGRRSKRKARARGMAGISETTGWQRLCVGKHFGGEKSPSPPSKRSIKSHPSAKSQAKTANDGCE